MKKFHAKHVSASESGGEYFQALFEEVEDDDNKAYLLIQRQFEMPSRGGCYVEDWQLSPCGHYVANAELTRNEFHLNIPGEAEGQWEIRFDIGDHEFEELKGVLKVILSSPNYLEIK